MLLRYCWSSIPIVIGEYLNPPRPTTPIRVRRVSRAGRRTIIRRRTGRYDPILPTLSAMALIPILNPGPGIRLVQPVFRIGSALAQRRTIGGGVIVRQAEKPISFEHTRGGIDAARADDLPPTRQRGRRWWRARIDLHAVAPPTG